MEDGEDCDQVSGAISFFETPKSPGSNLPVCFDLVADDSSFGICVSQKAHLHATGRKDRLLVSS